MRTAIMAMIGLGVMAGAAGADPVTGKAARKMLFSAKGAEVEMLAQDFLSADDERMLVMVGGGQPYYGAIAVSPDEGLMVEATVAAANYHDTEAASASALAGCEAKRKGKRPCRVVALIRPKGWKARGLQLSADATAAYLGGKAAALAISPSTGLWGMAAGKDAAGMSRQVCEERGGAGDCVLAIAD